MSLLKVVVAYVEHEGYPRMLYDGRSVLTLASTSLFVCPHTFVSLFLHLYLDP